MNENEKLPQDLKNTILDLIADLKDNLFVNADESGDMLVIEFFFKRMHPASIMQHAVKHILPHEKQIKKRDVNFFLDNSGIFAGLPPDRINHYRAIINARERFDEEDEDVVWQYLETITELVKTYRKMK